MNNPEKILILSVSGIGNTILQSPLINALLDQPNFKVDMLFGNSAMARVFLNDERIHFQYVVPNTLPEKFKLISKLRKNQYDYAIACFPSNRIEFNLLMFLSKAKKRIIHKYSKGFLKSLSFLSNVKIECNPYLHDVEQNMDLLRPLGLNPLNADNTLIFNTSKENEYFANDFCERANLKGKALIGIHAGCKQSESYRRWPGEKFSELINHLNELNYRCLLFSGPDERNTTLEIFTNLKHQDNNIIVEEKNINNVGALIKKCRAFLSTDSGLGHIATALKVKTLSIFGPAQHSRTEPYGKFGDFISLNLECSPCLKYPFKATHSRIKCPYKFKCLNNLTVDAVKNQLLDGLQSP